MGDGDAGPSGATVPPWTELGPVQYPDQLVELVPAEVDRQDASNVVREVNALTTHALNSVCSIVIAILYDETDSWSVATVLMTWQSSKVAVPLQFVYNG